MTMAKAPGNALPNWFGVGNVGGLGRPLNKRSSIQSYYNIYDMNWLTSAGNLYYYGARRC